MGGKAAFLAAVARLAADLLAHHVAQHAQALLRAPLFGFIDVVINELMENNKLPNLCIAINGLDLQKKKYGYYYGYGKYGKYYGYGKRYGYGYGEKHTSREGI